MLGAAAAMALAPVPGSTGVGSLPSRWREARTLLSRWARRLRKDDDHWYLVPGPDVLPAVAAVVALLVQARTDPGAASRAMGALRGSRRIGAGSLMQLQLNLDSPAAQAAVSRLGAISAKRKVWDDAEALVESLAMRPAEADLCRLLSGDDVLLANQSALRVAARVAGSDSATKNRLSDGKVDMARLVGAGPDAPLRMAALRLLGTELCKTEDRKCGHCPLAEWCASTAVDAASSAGGS
jgi:DNA (cytosine-5)-methyltransferase 1